MPERPNEPDVALGEPAAPSFASTARNEPEDADDTPDAELRRHLRDLTAVVSLPAVWRSRDPGALINQLAEVLAGLLHVSRVRVAFTHPAVGPIESVRPVADEALGGDGVQGTALAQLSVRPSRNPDCWTVELLSPRVGFPSDRERHLAQVTVDLAAIALENAVARAEVERALRDEADMARTIQRIGTSVTAELSIDRVVQTVTDAATELVGAQFGAFFYNLVDADGESYTLYTISGVPREMFSKFPMPRNTHVFEPTFRGTAVVRSDDIRRDERYGRNPPYYGMPKGHLPVVSYLAVPVVSRSGDVLGGLFFGHEQPSRFSERHEKLVVGIATWAALAIDNARLYQSERLARAEAERANAAKSEFLAAMSHELRTPLNAIQGHVQLLEMGLHGPLLPKQQEALERVQKSQRHLLSLINDILNFAKLEAGRVEYAIRPFPLAPLVSETVDVMGAQFADRGLTLQAELPVDLCVSADSDKVHQILLNLLSNALKFTERGGVAIKVADAPDDPAVVRLMVADTGIGIAADRQSSIFDPFVQVHRKLKGTDPGTGLGLTISRDLAHGMGGDLRVTSAEGKGSTFELRLRRGR